MFIMAFETSNDTFKALPWTAPIEVLKRVVHDLESGQVEGGVYDSNGIKIGSYQLTEGD
jgi:hypothetical protein